MITMRIGKQGILLWFRCFKTNCCTNEPFQESLIKEGITYVSNLFNGEFELIFLADRWFTSTKLMEHINSLGHIYRIRINTNIKVLIYDKKEKHNIWKWINNLKIYEYHSVFYENVLITDFKYKTNIVISKKQGVSEPWIIATNGDYKHALIDYSYRFGGIESLSKNQKSNGFYLENTVNASTKYFTAMYTLLCFTILFLTILGANYSKNKSCYSDVKITTHKVINGTKKRVMSLFNVGLTLFKRAFNSLKYIRIPYTFILYDI